MLWNLLSLTVKLGKYASPKGKAVFKSDGWESIVSHKDKDAVDIVWAFLPVLIFLAVFLLACVIGVI